MGEDLGGSGATWGFDRKIGRGTASRQGGADRALAAVEPFPDALPGSVAPMAVGNADRGGNAADDGTLEKLPECRGGQAQPSDFVGDPNAESPSATRTPMTITAKDPPGTHHLPLCVAVFKPGQGSMPNEHADRLAVRTRRLLEPLGDRNPILFVAIKPPLVVHVRLVPCKSP